MKVLQPVGDEGKNGCKGEATITAEVDGKKAKLHDYGKEYIS